MKSSLIRLLLKLQWKLKLMKSKHILIFITNQRKKKNKDKRILPNSMQKNCNKPKNLQ